MTFRIAFPTTETTATTTTTTTTATTTTATTTTATTATTTTTDVDADENNNTVRQAEETNTRSTVSVTGVTKPPFILRFPTVFLRPSPSHEGPSIPLCCRSNHLKTNSCQMQDNETLTSTLPIALNRCSAPDTREVTYNTTTLLDCPTKNFRKTILGEERKIVYDNQTLYFAWGQILVRNFCLLGDREEMGGRGGVEAGVCLPSWAIRSGRCRGVNTCLKKCCPMGSLLRGSSCVCRDSLPDLAQTFSAFFTSWGELEAQEGEDKEVEVGFPKCADSKYVRIDPLSMGGDIVLQPNGTLWTGAEKSLTDYCLDEEEKVEAQEMNEKEDEEKEGKNIDEDGKEEKEEGSVGRSFVLITCQNVLLPASNTSSSTWKSVRRVLIPAGLVVSCVFLAATLLCHLCVAPLRDRHGLCLAAYVSALLAADATLFLTQAFSKYFPPGACVFVAITLHVTFLSTFFWLNVICFDVWKYVGLTVQAVPLHRSPVDLRCFFAYAVYAWGSPLVIGVVAVTLHSLPDHVDWLLRPDFVHNSCWFRDGKEILAYFYGPMGVLCIANTLLISHTGLRLYCAADRKCDCLPASCCRNADHTLYRSYMTEFWQRFTLFALMVGCWVMEVVSWLVGPSDSELWALTDTLNTFQGVFIFITFLRSSKKRRLLQEALARWSDVATGRGGCDSFVSPPCLPAAASPNRIMDRLRHSSPLQVLVKWFSRLTERERPITTPQVLDNIIFKDKMEAYNGGFEEDEMEVEAKGGGRRSVCGGDAVNKSFNPMWTAPHWRARWSRSYFPGAPQRSSESQGGETGHEGLPGVIKGPGLTPSSSSSSSSSAASSSSPSEQKSPSFARWSLLRHKSGSLTLVTGQRPVCAGGEVVCHGLTKTEPGLP